MEFGTAWRHWEEWAVLRVEAIDSAGTVFFGPVSIETPTLFSRQMPRLFEAGDDRERKMARLLWLAIYWQLGEIVAEAQGARLARRHDPP